MSRSPVRPLTLGLGLALAALVAASPARAIIVITDAPSNGTPYTVTQIAASSITDPAFQNSGSQYEFAWQVGAGTAVAPNWFLTSSHLGGAQGDSFVFQGTTYTTINGGVDVGNGMMLWEVDKSFSSYAPIYANGFNALLGYTTSTFGYGVAADGQAVTGPTGQVQGYLWGSNAHNLTWGADKVDHYYSDTSNGYTYLSGSFIPNAGLSYNTGTGSQHIGSTFGLFDSGGGTFINVNGTWELAAVNYGVNAGYAGPGNGTTNPNGAFPSPDGGAALWDQTGFTSSGATVTGPQPWVSTNISPQVYALIAATVPEPGSLALLAAGAGLVVALGRRRLAGYRRP